MSAPVKYICGECGADHPTNLHQVHQERQAAYQPPSVATISPLRITSLDTGESLDLTLDCPVEDAYHRLLNLRAFQKALALIGDAWETAIAADMQERGATERNVDGILYEYKPGQSWVVDPEGMIDALRDLVEAGEITDAEFGDIVTYPPTPAPSVHNGKLNGLLKRGARVAEAIGKHRQQVPTGAKLVVKRAQP